MPEARCLSWRTKSLISAFCLVWISSLWARADEASQAKTLAIKYLQEESTSWPGENACFSCHNNGDAIRALLIAQPQITLFKKDSPHELLAWLNQPDEWLKATSEGVGESPILTYIQFGTARAEAVKAGIMSPASKIENKIFQKIYTSQSPDGSWHVEPESNTGSPGTYGNALASYHALRLLKSGPSKISGPAIQQCVQWAARFEPKATVDVAAIALLLSEAESTAWKERSKRLRLHLLRSQNKNGGWGVFPNRFSEVFDTAIASIALSQTSHMNEDGDNLDQARKFLIKTQEETGGWPETTRPSGGVSYAQHISTTSWALIALTQISEPVHPGIARPNASKKTPD